MFAVAAFAAICVSTEASIHTTNNIAASGKSSSNSSWKTYISKMLKLMLIFE